MEIELPFATQEGKSSVLQNSRETLVNMYAEIETSGRRKITRRQRPGLSQVYPITGEKRCIERFGSLHYMVIDATFYKFDGTTLTSLGTLSTNSGRCSMIFDDTGDVMISDALIGYHYTGGALSVIVHSTNIGHVTFQGGYGIFSQPDTGTFWVTALNDFATIDPLDFATAEGNPDPLVRAFVDHNELWLFGVRSTEVWQLSGAADFPFSPARNLQLERGCGAATSVASEDNTLYWLGDDWIVYRADGYRPSRVSTHTIERAINEVPVASRADADAFFYSHEGHKFYVLRFPDYFTAKYDVATGLWCMGETYGHADWRVIGSMGRTTDYLLTDTGIVSLSGSTNQDEGGIMRRKAVSAPIWANGKRVSVRAFFLDCEVGRAGAGVDPQIMLRYAPDGETFGNEKWRSLGTTGNYKQRAEWRNLGMGRRGTVEITFSDDAEFKIVGSDGVLSVAS